MQWRLPPFQVTQTMAHANRQAKVPGQAVPPSTGHPSLSKFPTTESPSGGMTCDIHSLWSRFGFASCFCLRQVSESMTCVDQHISEDAVATVQTAKQKNSPGCWGKRWSIFLPGHVILISRPRSNPSYVFLQKLHFSFRICTTTNHLHPIPLSTWEICQGAYEQPWQLKTRLRIERVRNWKRIIGIRKQCHLSRSHITMPCIHKVSIRIPAPLGPNAQMPKYPNTEIPKPPITQNQILQGKFYLTSKLDLTI